MYIDSSFDLVTSIDQFKNITWYVLVVPT